VEQEAKARDVRLQRALEEVERHKVMLQEVRMQVRLEAQLQLAHFINVCVKITGECQVQTA
jgi:hypothetical protein